MALEEFSNRGYDKSMYCIIFPIFRNFKPKTTGHYQQQILILMQETYYDPKDLKKFGKISEWNEDLGDKFFEYYKKVFEAGALSPREKSLIALAVAHTIQCPYCIDAYTGDGLQRGITKEEMMEALHVAGAIRGGATMVHGVQMMNKYNKLSM